MATSIKAVAKYNAKTYDDIKVRVRKGHREKIRTAADAKGESLNNYIVQAVDARMEREKGENNDASS